MNSNQSTSQMQNMRENFRAEIRKKDQETFFLKKRLMYKQPDELPNLQKEETLVKMKETIVQQNLPQLRLLHLLVFKFVCENLENEIYFTNNSYLEFCLQTLQLGSLDCYQVLANLCLNPSYPHTQTTQAIFNISITLLNTPNQLQENTLVFLGNVVSQQQLNLINLLPKILQLSLNANDTLTRGIIYLLTALIENTQLDDNQKFIGIQIVINSMNLYACEENLMPLGKLYDQKFDEILLKSSMIDVLVTHDCTMIDKCFAIMKLLTLSDSLAIANKLLDLNILDKLQCQLSNQSMLIKKEIYLILSNLSYNDSAITTRIIQHPIVVKVVNNIITSNEKGFCMSVILNLQATGTEDVSRKLLDLGLIQIVISLLDIQDVGILKQSLDSILRFLTIVDVKEKLKQQNIQNKLELLYSQQHDETIQELCLKIKQLI